MHQLQYRFMRCNRRGIRGLFNSDGDGVGPGILRARTRLEPGARQTAVSGATSHQAPVLNFRNNTIAELPEPQTGRYCRVEDRVGADTPDGYQALQLSVSPRPAVRPAVRYLTRWPM